MKKSIYYSLLMSAMMSVAAAEETRQVDKHEHGVGELNIAVEGSAINLEFMIPGADIVGFEYEAKSDSDIALVNTALSKFQDFENIFTLSSSGNCNLVDAEVEINQGDDHEDEHDHDEHEEEAHNEFVAHYSFTCGNVKEIDRIDFHILLLFLTLESLKYNLYLKLDPRVLKWKVISLS